MTVPANHATLDQAHERYRALVDDGQSKSALDAAIIATGWTHDSKPVEETFFDETAEYVRQALRLTGQEDLLEVGCSMGFLLSKIKPFARTVAGTDFSAEALAKFYDPQVKVACAEARSQPFPDHSFDAVFCHGVFQSLPSLEYAHESFDELLRVTRPGGRVLISGLHNRALQADFYKGPLDPHVVDSVPAALRHALIMAAWNVRSWLRRKRRPKKMSQPLFFDPQDFRAWAQASGVAISFPHLVISGPAGEAMKYRFGVLLEKPRSG